MENIKVVYRPVYRVLCEWATLASAGGERGRGASARLSYSRHSGTQASVARAYPSGGAGLEPSRPHRGITYHTSLMWQWQTVAKIMMMSLSARGIYNRLKSGKEY